MNALSTWDIIGFIFGAIAVAMLVFEITKRHKILEKINKNKKNPFYRIKNKINSINRAEAILWVLILATVFVAVVSVDLVWKSWDQIWHMVV